LSAVALQPVITNPDPTARRALAILNAETLALYSRTDRMFAALMLVQWAFAIVMACLLTPRTWNGAASQIHPHVYQAVFLGALINSLPVYLAVRAPGQVLTRHVIASAQMLWSGLLIHVTGGRIETHFHIFGSLAFVAFYRDWRLFIPATTVVTLDHLFRGLFLPESVYGVLVAGPWRTVEHAGWVVFEVIFLAQSCRRSMREMTRMARQHAELEHTNATIECEVLSRTEELKRVNDELMARSHDLEWERQRLVAANTHLADAQTKIEAAARSKDEFLANMSHEIRTPMTAILGYADLLLEPGTIDPNAREQVDAVQTIRRNGHYLLRLINDILDLSKIEAGRMLVEQLDVDPISVLADVARLMQLRSAEKKLAVFFRIDGLMPSLVRTDPTRLRQILINLVGNAIKFTDKGSVRISMRHLIHPKPILQFDIVDTGIGMTPVQAGRLFEPFEQADGTFSRRFGGTGLGLVISKRFAQLLGGDVTLIATGPTGTRFQVVLDAPPATQATEHSEHAANQLLRDAGQRTEYNAAMDLPERKCTARQILLAEDGVDNQRLLMHMLSRMGATVVLASNGREAIDLAMDARQVGKPFDLILMDMQMPEIDGYAATAELRRLGFDTPIIALTAHAMVGDREKCIASGCTDYTSKPVSKANLISLVHRYAGGDAIAPCAPGGLTPIPAPADMKTQV